MDFKELILLALETLKNNLVRTLLTMLGIIIGIASVITIISLGKGSTASIVEDISSFGADVITVLPGKSQRRPGPGMMSNIKVTTLTSEDGEAIAKLSNVEAVSSEVSQSKQITADTEDTTAPIKGVEASYANIKSLEISSGLFLDKSYIDSLSRVVILGDEVVEELFGEGADVVGKTVKIDSRTFRIIGMVADDSNAYVPLSTAQKIMFGQDNVNSISVAVTDSELVEQVETDIENLLLIRHDIANPEDADFNLLSSQNIISTVSSITNTLTSMVSGIAAISLLVGGIGIMNIMLVTVTERTKEIGLLKAIGAKKNDILTQFLIEAVVLTVFGGLVGMSMGIGITYVASSMLNIPFVISISSVILAIGVSAGVGILFGWYPAGKAAKLKPIDALRYE